MVSTTAKRDGGGGWNTILWQLIVEEDGAAAAAGDLLLTHRRLTPRTHTRAQGPNSRSNKNIPETIEIAASLPRSLSPLSSPHRVTLSVCQDGR